MRFLNKRSILFSLALPACMLLFAGILAAQYRAGIQGVITDPSGAGVPGATVTLTSKETNIVRKTTSTEDGGYAIPGLPPGAYALSVEKAGFSKKTLENVVIAGEELQSVAVEYLLRERSQRFRRHA